MKWNPYFNALGVALYILGLGLLIEHISSLHSDTPDNLIGTISAFSLFTFTAAVMAFLFFYRPVALLIENRKEEAIIFFLKTLGTFGVITALVVSMIV
jgi:hypothetical protein